MTVARYWGLVVGLTLVVAGCGEAPPETATTQGESELSQENILLLASTRVGLPPTGVTAADLPEPESAGAKALQEFCVTCHALPLPGSHSATDWPGVVRRMWMRIDKVAPEFGVPSPTAAQRVAILRYLEQHALKVTRGNLPNLAGRDAFTTTCGRCHELPDPRQHTPTDWVAVVDRMSRHMQEMLGETPSREHQQRIEFFLQSVSRGRAQ